jgi:hypothetical protein
MGIAPITGLIPLSQARTVKTDLEPVPMERVENSARTGDESYSPSNGKPGRGSEDDAEEEGPEDASFESTMEEAEKQPANPSTAQPSESSDPLPISFFA